MKKFFIIASFAAFIAVTSAQTPQIKWWFDTNDMSFGNSAMADVDNDGLPEIVFSTYRNDERIIVLNAEDGSLLWDYNTGGCNDVAPVIFDVDQDNELEIILPSSCVPETFCFDAATGEIEWTTPTHGSDSPPSIGDVDNDGKPEILHGEFNGWIICINGEDGSIEWEFNADPDSWIQTAPTILDVDNNEQLDFVVANWSFGTNHRIWAFRGSDHEQIWTSDLPEDVMYHGASHADIDGDGFEELALGDYSGVLYVLNAEDGSLLWDYSVASPMYIGAPTSIADLDNDDLFEIVFSDWYKVVAMNNDGTPLWSYSIPGYGSTFRGAAISDVNSDETPDVVFGTSEGNLIALNGGSGNLLWNIDLQAHFGSDEFEIDHGPVIADFDNDGLLDAFVVGGHAEYPNIQNNYGRGYAVSLESPGGPDWTMFRRDIRRTACVCDNGVVINKEEEITAEKAFLFPNPNNGNLSVNVNNVIGDFRITVHDMFLRNILLIDYESIDREMISVSLPVVKDGVYFLNLIDESGFKSAIFTVLNY